MLPGPPIVSRMNSDVGRSRPALRADYPPPKFGELEIVAEAALEILDKELDRMAASAAIAVSEQATAVGNVADGADGDVH